MLVQLCDNIVVGCDSFDVSNKIEAYCQLELNITLLMVDTDYVWTIHYSEAHITSTCDPKSVESIQMHVCITHTMYSY